MQQRFPLWLLAACCWLAGCGSDKFSEEHPFAVQVQQYRYPQEAEELAERLSDMGLDAYTAAYAPVGEGPWYGVFLGGYDELDDMVQAKLSLEEQYGMKTLDKANFHQVEAIRAPFPEDLPSLRPEEGYRLPALPQQAGELLRALPYVPGMRLVSVQLLPLPFQGASRELPELRGIKFDFPRGLVPSLLYSHSEALACLRLEDELLGKETQLIALRLKPENPFGGNPAERFAESILGTKRYELEHITPISTGYASGFTVSIVPSPGKTKLYMVLYHAASRTVFFGESRAREYALEDWQELAKRLGRDEGNALDYHAMHRFLSVLPLQSEGLVYLHGRRLLSPKGKGQRLLRGQLEADYVLWEGEGQRPFQATVAFMADAPSAQSYYREAFPQASSRQLQVDTVRAAGYPALWMYQKRQLRRKEYQQVPVKAGGLFASDKVVSAKLGGKADWNYGQLVAWLERFRWATPQARR